MVMNMSEPFDPTEPIDSSAPRDAETHGDIPVQPEPVELQPQSSAGLGNLFDRIRQDSTPEPLDAAKAGLTQTAAILAGGGTDSLAETDTRRSRAQALAAEERAARAAAAQADKAERESAESAKADAKQAAKLARKEAAAAAKEVKNQARVAARQAKLEAKAAKRAARDAAKAAKAEARQADREARAAEKAALKGIDASTAQSRAERQAKIRALKEAAAEVRAAEKADERARAEAAKADGKERVDALKDEHVSAKRIEREARRAKRKGAEPLPVDELSEEEMWRLRRKERAQKPKKISKARAKELALAERNQQTLEMANEASGEMPQFGPKPGTLGAIMQKKSDAGEMAASLRSLSFLLSTLSGELEPVRIMARELSGTWLGDMYSRIGWRLAHENMTLAAAFEAEPAIPAVVIAFMRVGSSTGQNASSIKHAAELLEEANSGNKKLKNVLMSPLFMMIMMLVGVIAVAQVSIPQLMGMYTSMHMEVPPVTRALDIGGQLIMWLTVALAVAGIGYFLWYTFSGRKNFRWRTWLDRKSLELPMYGTVARSQLAYITSLFLAALLRVGESERGALLETAQATSNRSMRLHLQDISAEIGEGRATVADVADGVHMPRIAGYVLRASEDSGRLIEGLEQIRDGFRSEQAVLTERFVGQVERLSTSIIGVMFAVVAIMITVPQFELTNAMMTLTN